MRVLRSADFRRMPWKNGGGETTEVAIAPAGAALDEFDWRISMAHVGADGPFSAFPGIDRTLTVLSGAGIRLAFDAATPVELGVDSAPFSFAGDAPVAATLVAGPITDLNVMTRRSRYVHRVRRERLGANAHLALTAEVTVVLCTGGTLRVHADREAADLGAWDAAVLEAAGAGATLAGAPGIGYFVIELGRVT